MIKTSDITPKASVTFGDLCRRVRDARTALRKASAHTSELLADPDFVPHSIVLHTKTGCLREELEELAERVDAIERTYIRQLRNEAQK